MTIRAKFQCHYIHKSDDGLSRTVNLNAVTTGSPENEEWSKYTPGGQISIHISNPAAFNKFEQGKEYYVDFTEA
ncbi:hypothetical protein [Pantoea ananatis]|uniref:hypothetical protein n=1 Tax=Pantoea ananas TaxID=553 RepID=UPI000FEC8F38|nr:hypothetical protein [Pantoea ananatis]QAB30911.1 hypothetical protein EPK90_14485 [Pantoea ananatis]